SLRPAPPGSPPLPGWPWAWGHLSARGCWARRIRSKALNAYGDNKANGAIITARTRPSMNRHRGPVQDRHGLARGADGRNGIYATAQGPYRPLLPDLSGVRGTVVDIGCRPGARPGQVPASRAPVSVMPGH